jgi:hypothetical protein
MAADQGRRAVLESSERELCELFTQSGLRRDTAHASRALILAQALGNEHTFGATRATAILQVLAVMILERQAGQSRAEIQFHSTAARAPLALSFVRLPKHKHNHSMD